MLFQTCSGRAGRRLGAIAADQRQSAGRNHRGDHVAGGGVAVEEWRRARLGPDQRGDRRLALGRSAAQRQMPAEGGDALRRIVLQRLLDRGLHDPELDAGHVARGPGAEPRPAEAETGEQHGRGRHQRQRLARAEIPQRRRQHRQCHRQQAQAIDSHHRRQLQHGEAAGEGAGPGVAHQVPGEAGENMAAQPLGGGPQHRQRQHPRDAAPAQAAAEQLCRQQRAAGEDCQPRRHPQHREGQQPPEARDVDEERGGDPVEAGDEESEAEAPAEAESLARPLRAVEEPDQAGEGDQQDRREVDRRQRRRRQHAQQEGDAVAPEALQLGEPDRRELRRGHRRGAAETQGGGRLRHAPPR